MFSDKKERNVLGRKHFLFPITLHQVDPVLEKRIEKRDELVKIVINSLLHFKALTFCEMSNTSCSSQVRHLAKGLKFFYPKWVYKWKIRVDTRTVNSQDGNQIGLSNWIPRAGRSSTVLGVYCAWFRDPAFSLQGVFFVRGTSCEALTHGSKIMHSCRGILCRMFGTLLWGCSSAGVEDHALFLGYRVHDFVTVRSAWKGCSSSGVPAAKL